MDNFSNHQAGLSSPVSRGFAITPSTDGSELTEHTRGLYLGSTGDVACVLSGGSSVTLRGLATGVIHPLRVKMVKGTGTTSTDLVGFA